MFIAIISTNDCWSDANDGKGLRIYKYSTGQRKYFKEVEEEPNVEEGKVKDEPDIIQIENIFTLNHKL